LVEDVWPALRSKLAAAIRRYSRAELEAMFDGSDACVSPILSMQEALEHPHNVARKAFIEVDGVAQNAPVPRFSRSRPKHPQAPRAVDANTLEILKELGLSTAQIEHVLTAR
jgi:alpha-methylacyl-CoA racemase